MPLEPEVKSVLDSISTGFSDLQKAYNDLQRQTDAIDSKLADRVRAHPGGASGGGGARLLTKSIVEDPDMQRFLRTGRRGRVGIVLPPGSLQSKAITSDSLGLTSSGVLQSDRAVSGIVPGAERRLFLRDVLPVARTEAALINYVRESGFSNGASPQIEGNVKGESGITFAARDERIRTIAHWLAVSKQAFDDLPVLGAYLNRKLLYGLRLEEDKQILHGDGTGENLNGLMHSATAFNTSLLPASAGWSKLDVLRRAALQVELADEVAVGFYVLSPSDWADMETGKDKDGNYILGAPSRSTPATIWGRPAVISTAMPSGQFLAGSASSALLVDRQDATVEVSSEHSDYFVKNMLAVRAEERLALLNLRPAAFVRGTFSQSPA